MKRLGPTTQKWTIILVAIVTVLVLANAPALAAAWTGQLSPEGKVKEPFSPHMLTIEPQEVWPGQTITWKAENKNNSPLSYGATYYGLVFYDYYTYGGMGATEKFIARTSNTTPERKLVTEKITLASPKTRAGGTSSRLGDFFLYIDPDGPGPRPEEPYDPGSVLDIKPEETHILRIVLKTSFSAEEGQIRGAVDVYRQAPTTPNPTLIEGTPSIPNAYNPTETPAMTK